MAQRQLFLIEEIENDVHPRALKSLLQLITKKAENNQFVISTHSNIVTRYLGIVPESKIHEITIAPYTRANRIPTSTYKEVKTPEKRMAAVESLGYELIDAEIWDGWLLLEESSAERVIQELLIPSFAPKLHGRMKTVSTKGVNRAKARFEAMNNLFLYAHLTPVYKNRAWVMVDGDIAGREVIQELKEEDATEQGGWQESNFINLRETDFEKYYPERFRTEVDSVLSLPRDAKPAAKRSLLQEVLSFIENDRETAKVEFAQSAGEVIILLRAIEESLFPVGLPIAIC
jgi:predicted ATP-dependent endonuclease of OLD family